MNSENDAIENACAALEGVYDDVERAVDGLETRRPADDRTDTQAALFGALANEHRLRILEALREGELCACELQVVLEAPQSTVATHLRTLREAGLIAGRKKGKWTYYRITDTAVFELLDLGAAVDAQSDD